MAKFKSIDKFGGSILIIGGAEDKFNERHILKKFIALSGGKRANVLIIPIASDFAEQAGEVYSSIFTKMGVKSVKVMNLKSRQEVMQVDAKKLFDRITGVFITGGDQLRLSTILGGTEVLHTLQTKLKTGMVLAGSSAGAACMSAAMIVRGESQIHPNRDSVRIAPGLGILKHIIIDQHFTQRTRLNRLITAVCYNADFLGIGIDENTAIYINPEGILQVIGEGTVTIVDGSKVNYLDIAEVNETEPFSVFGLQLHILNHTIKYDIVNRTSVMSDTED